MKTLKTDSRNTLLWTAFGLSAALASGMATAAIFVTDTRQDLYEVTDPSILEIAKSTVLLVDNSGVANLYGRDPLMTKDTVTGNFNLRQRPFSQSKADILQGHSLCSSVKYLNQTSIGKCSGALVGPDLILTAAHCIPDQETCDNWVAVFGFDAANAADPGGLQIPAANIYKCKSILSTSGAPQEFGTKHADYTLFRLDRTVTDRNPLAVETHPTYTTNETLFTLGHPTGLPTKLATGEVISLDPRNPLSSWMLETSVTAFGGNSGGPVFDTETKKIVGVLEGGADDFSFDSTNNCEQEIVYNSCFIGSMPWNYTMVTKTSAIDFAGSLP